MPSMHVFQQAICARLKRQMKLVSNPGPFRHEIGQGIGPVVGMGRREPDALQTVQLREFNQQIVEAETRSVVGVHVLAQEPDFFRAVGDEGSGFTENVFRFPAHFPTPRIRHHAEGAEIIAALRDGEIRLAAFHVAVFYPFLGEKITAMKIENTKKSLYVYQRTWQLFLNPKS